MTFFRKESLIVCSNRPSVQYLSLRSFKKISKTKEELRNHIKITMWKSYTNRRTEKVTKEKKK
jgi:hypothetical protein